MERAGGRATVTTARQAAPRSSSTLPRRPRDDEAPRVVLVDDHDLFLAGVRAELGDAVEVVGEAGTVAEAVPLIASSTPRSCCSTCTCPTAAATR